MSSFGLLLLALWQSISLLRIVNQHTLMANQDMGEMFLNFHLHSDTVQFAGIDMGPLDFTSEECNQWWMCWKHNLMGFKASPLRFFPYNLMAEEIICDDRHDNTNAF
jgi:hypothetical protein